MKPITIPIRGGYTIVDAEDEELVRSYLWRVNNNGYAMRTVCLGDRNTSELLHRVINKTPVDMDTDHINGNRLDNRKSNLRTSSRKDNTKNRRLNANNSSGYRGVYWNKNSRKWLVYITIDGVKTYLGGFHDKEDAARAFGLAAERTHGAYLNRSSLHPDFHV